MDKNPVEALRIYRLKDLIEKSCGNLKERLSMRRMSVASEENFEGKLFIQFIALQMVSYIKNGWMKKDCLASTQSSHYLMNWIPLNITSSLERHIIYLR